MKKIKGGRGTPPVSIERPPGGGSYVRQPDGSLVLADAGDREEPVSTGEEVLELGSGDTVDGGEGAAATGQEV